MPISQEEKQHILSLPNLSVAATMVVSKNTLHTSNEYTEAYTLKNILTSSRGGFLLVLQASNGQEYTYTPSMVEYGKIRRLLLKGTKLKGRKVIFYFHQGSLGAGGAVYSPRLTVGIQGFESLRGGLMKF